MTAKWKLTLSYGKAAISHRPCESNDFIAAERLRSEWSV